MLSYATILFMLAVLFPGGIAIYSYCRYRHFCSTLPTTVEQALKQTFTKYLQHALAWGQHQSNVYTNLGERQAVDDAFMWQVEEMMDPPITERCRDKFRQSVVLAAVHVQLGQADVKSHTGLKPAVARFVMQRMQPESMREAVKTAWSAFKKSLRQGRVYGSNPIKRFIDTLALNRALQQWWPKMMAQLEVQV